MITKRTFCAGALVGIAIPFRAAAAVFPEAFGARGDGTGNDEPALRRALAMGRHVQLRSGGRYRVTQPIRMPSGSSLVGSGGSLILPVTTTAILIEGASDVRLENFGIVGQRQVHRGSGLHGVFVDWRGQAGRNVALTGITVREVAGAGIIALASGKTRSSGFTTAACTVDSVGAHGIIAQDHIDNVLVEGCYVRATGLMVADRPGITASRFGRNVIVRNNRCFGAAAALGRSTHAISLDQCERALCSDNVVRGWPHGYGIEIGGVRGGEFSRNDVGDTNYGIVLSGVSGVFSSEDVVIADNRVDRVQSAGLYAFVDGPTGRHRRITIQSCRVRDVSGSQIGIGAFLTDIETLVIRGLDVRECRKSGVSLIDCIGYSIDDLVSVGNNLAGDPAHAGLAIRWLTTPLRARGTNRLGRSQVSGNWRERNVVQFDR
jgi:hypothetical protein